MAHFKFSRHIASTFGFCTLRLTLLGRRSFSMLGAALPGAISALVVIALLKLGGFQSFEQITYKTLFQLRGPIPWDERIAVVAIDNQSLQRLGRFPLSRQHYTTLIEKLTLAQPNVVAFDLVFSEPSPEDSAFAAAMRQHQQVVLAQAWDSTGQLWQPTDQLRQAAIATGHISTQVDQDSIIRQIIPQLQGTPAFGVVAAQVYDMALQPIDSPNFRQPLWLNYPGSIQQITHYSLIDVLEGRVASEVWKDKIILVGVTATGLDSRETPFDNNATASGVYIHAVAVNNLLQSNFLQVPNQVLILGFLITIALGQSVVMATLNGYHHRLFGTALCLTWGLICVTAFRYGNYLLPVVSPMALFGLTTLISSSKKHTRLEEKVQILTQLSTIDALTQIPNRRCFDDYLMNEWRRAMRGQTPLSILFCDVDFFKKFNDTYGHQTGDLCLVRVASAMHQALNRGADLVARYGGEEFVVILPDTPIMGAVQVATRIQTNVQALKIPHRESVVSEFVTLSIGIASVVPNSDISIKELLEAADAALYKAKHSGRNRIVGT
jgi:adenylate cyclase